MIKEKELIKKIESLKTVQPDDSWKKNNRDILFSQISNSASVKKVSFFVVMREFLSQPSLAVIAVVAFLVLGSMFGVRVINLKPGNSLYIAQVISENAQMAITFNQEKRSKLSLKFASERAKSITQVLSEASFEENDKNKTERLASDFRKEINTVKEKINEINNYSNQDEEMLVAGASLNKEDDGLEIYIQEEEASAEAGSENRENINASSTEITENENPSNLDEAHRILDEAENLFDQKDYDGVLDKLNEVDNLLDGDEGVEAEENSVDSSTTTEVAE